MAGKTGTSQVRNITAAERARGVIRNDPRGRGRILSLRRADLDDRFPGLLAAVLAAQPPIPEGLSEQWFDAAA